MFRIITTLILVCALAFAACDDDKEKPSEDCEEAPVAAVEAPDAGLPEECAGDDCPPVEEECLEDCEPVEEPEPEPEPEPAGEEDPVEEPVEEPQAGEESTEVDPPIPG